MTTTQHQQDLHREQEQEPEPEQEQALADLDLPEERAGDVTGGDRGACEDWGCGMNHNEVLAVTASGPG